MPNTETDNNIPVIVIDWNKVSLPVFYIRKQHWLEKNHINIKHIFGGNVSFQTVL